VTFKITDVRLSVDEVQL